MPSIKIQIRRETQQAENKPSNSRAFLPRCGAATRLFVFNLFYFLLFNSQYNLIVIWRTEFYFWIRILTRFSKQQSQRFQALVYQRCKQKSKTIFSPFTSRNRHSTFCLSYICLRFQFLYANSKCSPMLPETVHIFDFLFFMNCLCSEYANQMNWLCGSVMCHKRIAILLRMSTCLAGCLPACVLAFFPSSVGPV